MCDTITFKKIFLLSQPGGSSYMPFLSLFPPSLSLCAYFSFDSLGVRYDTVQCFFFSILQSGWSFSLGFFFPSFLFRLISIFHSPLYLFFFFIPSTCYTILFTFSRERKRKKTEGEIKREELSQLSWRRQKKKKKVWNG